MNSQATPFQKLNLFDRLFNRAFGFLVRLGLGFAHTYVLEVAGEVRLRKGRQVQQFRVRALSEAERPPILKAYLDRFHREVQRFFPVPAGSPVEMFVSLAPRYPAFELLSNAGASK